MSSLVVDISSGSVGAGLVVKKPGGTELVYSYRRDLLSPQGIESRGFEKHLLVALKAVLERVFHEGLKIFREKGFQLPLDHAMVTLSSPWIKSILLTREVKADYKFSFDRTVAEEMIKREKSNLIEEGKFIIGPSIMSLSQNGYSVPFPSHKKSREAEVTLLGSKLSESLAENIEAEIRKIFGLKRGVQFQSLPFIMSQIFLEQEKVHNPVALVVAGGECLDIVFLAHGHVRKVVPLNFGAVILIRSISEHLLLPMSVAASALDLLGRGDLTEARQAEIGKAIQNLESKGLPRDVEKDMADLFNNNSHPETLYLLARPDVAPVYNSLFSAVLPTSTIKMWHMGENVSDERLLAGGLYSGSHL